MTDETQLEPGEDYVPAPARGPWMIFDTLDEAQTYADNATSLLPHGPGDVTAAWDVPRALTDGRWLVAAYSGEGVPWDDTWELVVPDVPEPDPVPEPEPDPE